MHLWFKQIYVAPILSGEKTDTIRNAGKCKLQAGDVVTFSVGPRPAFATAKILTRENIALNELTPERREQVATLYDADGDFCRLTFRLVS